MSFVGSGARVLDCRKLSGPTFILRVMSSVNRRIDALTPCILTLLSTQLMAGCEQIDMIHLGP